MNQFVTLNNPHTFTIQIKNGNTHEVAYAMPYNTLDTPTWNDAKDIAVHLANNVSEQLTRHNWVGGDLSYDIDCHSIQQSDMGFNLLKYIDAHLHTIIDEKKTTKK